MNASWNLASPHLLPMVTTVILPELPLPRAAMDELCRFLQYLQFKYQMDLELAIESVEDSIDIIDARDALAEGGGIPWNQAKQELGLT
jgi:hypothetical protein